MAVVEYTLTDGVAAVELNRPERLNAQNTDLVTGLRAALHRANEDDARVVVLSGRGRAFCAGHDLREPEPVGETDTAAVARLQQMQDVTRAMRAFRGPVIAAVHGYALGAGAEFALGADLIVASADTQFGFPEVSVGLSVTGGISALLPRVVGPARAKTLLILGERFSAEQALAWGLISQVVPDRQHLEAAQALAVRCGERPRQALWLAKQLLDAGADGDETAAFDREVQAALVTLRGEESAAARTGFTGGAAGEAT